MLIVSSCVGFGLEDSPISTFWFLLQFLTVLQNSTLVRGGASFRRSCIGRSGLAGPMQVHLRRSGPGSGQARRHSLYIDVDIYIYLSIYLSLRTYILIYLHLSLYISISISISKFMSISMICLLLYFYLYLYLHISVSRRSLKLLRSFRHALQGRSLPCRGSQQPRSQSQTLTFI